MSGQYLLLFYIISSKSRLSLEARGETTSYIIKGREKKVPLFITFLNVLTRKQFLEGSHNFQVYYTITTVSL